VSIPSGCFCAAGLLLLLLLLQGLHAADARLQELYQLLGEDGR
jgi:hypothetical protein